MAHKTIKYNKIELEGNKLGHIIVALGDKIVFQNLTKNTLI